MAESKLSATWEVKQFKEKLSPLSEEFSELHHQSLPGLKWKARLLRAGLCASDGFCRLLLIPEFGRAHGDAKYAWANVKATLLDEKEGDVVTVDSDALEFTPEKFDGVSYSSDYAASFKVEDVNKAVRKDGSLLIRIDLTILNIGEVLKSRKLLSSLLRDNSLAYFKVGVEEQTFSLHKSILAQSSTVFAAMFERDAGKAVDDVISLKETAVAAFKAFSAAIYCDNRDFLSDVYLTQDVLLLAEKFRILDLKGHCDEMLAGKVNIVNALEILTKSATLCNASKTKAACIAILADHTEFKKSLIWARFKERYCEEALDVLEAVSDNLIMQNYFWKCDIAEMNAELERETELKEESLAEQMALEFMLQNAHSVIFRLEDKLKQASTIESELRADVERLQLDGVTLNDRMELCEQQKKAINLELADLKAKIGHQNIELASASFVETQLRANVKRLQKDRGGLCEVISALQNEETLLQSELARLKEECPICMEQYSAARLKQVLSRCEHCFCHVCIASVQHEARSRRVGNDPVVFKCPTCRADILDVVQPINN